MTPDSPTLADVQAQVDEWITTIGVRYFSAVSYTHLTLPTKA